MNLLKDSKFRVTHDQYILAIGHQHWEGTSNIDYHTRARHAHTHHNMLGYRNLKFRGSIEFNPQQP